jgi:sugar lactone lactonase YvrE
MSSRAVLALGLLLTSFLVGVPQSAADTTPRPRWDTRVFATVPSPGFPAYVYRHPNGRVYAGTYTNLLGDAIASRVFEWTADGTLLRSWTVPGQDLATEHGVQVATSDARGRLVLLERSTSSVLTLNLRTGRFRTQARLPDLPRCATGRQPCSPNAADSPAIPNYATWGPRGALFVSDYGQAVIWRIPARGGTPRIWFASAALDGTEFGTTGLVYEPARRAFLIAQQTTSALTSNPPVGKLYRLSVDDAGRPGALTTLWRSRIGELPDGFGVARSGRIYVANVGLSNQLVELSADGRELNRFPKVPVLGDNGSPVPFDGPSSATFLGTRVLVANQSPLLGTRSHHVVLDVEVGEEGAPAYVPRRSRLR